MIGRREDDRCDCREVQNPVHLLRCPLVGDEKGRTIEECYGDEEWCKAVEEFLRPQ